MKHHFTWLANHNIIELIKLLSYDNHKFYFVGGCLRDSILNLAISDFDLASNFTPQQNMEALKNSPYTIIPSGLKYGSISIKINETMFNLTTLRQDNNWQGRACDVSFNNDIYEDAKRRDFTINALYLDPHSGELFDFFDSIEHINQKKLEFIGDANIRITEDYLRILRYFRFYNHLKIHNPPSNDLIKNFQAHCHTIKELSQTRIHNEFSKIISSINCYKALYYMQKSNVLQQILPTNLENIQAIDNLTALSCLDSLDLDNQLIILSILLNYNYDLKNINLIFAKKYWEKLNQILMLRDFIMLHNILDYNELAKLTINYHFDNMLIAIIATAVLKPTQLHIYNNLIELLIKKQQLTLPINGEDLLNIGIEPIKIKSILNRLTFEFWNNPILDKIALLNLAKEQRDKNLAC